MYVSVEWWEKLYKDDSNEDLTWLCICQCISGMVREVLQKKLKWGFNMSMHYAFACVSVEWWEKLYKEDLRIQHEYVFACVSVE